MAANRPPKTAAVLAPRRLAGGTSIGGAPAPQGAQRTVRRGVILPVVLMVLLLIGLLAAMFSFRVNADLSSTQVIAYRLQTRLAAEAGIDRVKLLLRESRFDIDKWYHNADELHRIIVWSHDGDPTIWGSNDEFTERTMAYRFSIVADDPEDDEDRIRLGITDEASKLNLNTATEKQLLVLVRAAVEDEQQTDPLSIVNAILDWRDADHVPRRGHELASEGGDGGKDGEQDGEKEGDTPRGAKKNTDGDTDGDTEGGYYKMLPKPYKVKNAPFDTVEELLLVKGVTGRILYGEDWDRNGLLTVNEDDGDESFPMDNEDGVLNRGLYPYLTVHSHESNVSNDNRPRANLLGDAEALRSELELAFPDDPDVVDFIVTATRAKGKGGDKKPGNGGKGGRGGTGGKYGSTGSPGGDDSKAGGDGLGGSGEPNGGGESDEAGPGPGGQSGGEEPTSAPIRSPASLLREKTDSGQTIRWNNPLTLEHLPILMDRTTTHPADEREIAGLISINTAPRLVLQCVEGLSAEQIEAIVETRDRLTLEERSTTAWLLVEEIVDLDTFELVAPQITARGQQFTVESLGYADHVGMVTRLQVVLDMVGPIAQTVYYRDLTYLGGHYPIREKDLETLRVR